MWIHKKCIHSELRPTMANRPCIQRTPNCPFVRSSDLKMAWIRNSTHRRVPTCTDEYSKRTSNVFGCLCHKRWIIDERLRRFACHRRRRPRYHDTVHLHKITKYRVFIRIRIGIALRHWRSMWNAATETFSLCICGALQFNPLIHEANFFMRK